MRIRVFLSIVLLLALASVPGAQQGTGAEPTALPVRRVVLYKSGVGYFEHLGSVTGSASVVVQFTSAQLNDVLASLTALDLDDGQIAGISYNSIAPIQQRLGALRLPLGPDAGVFEFYDALRGARVDVHAGTTAISGRLLGIEQKSRTRDGTREDVQVITVISDAGTVRSIPLGPDVSVQVGERDLREEIGRYLGVIASGRDQDVRRMTLSTTGTGTRRIFVSYISEVPIWKSTYRLVLPDAEDGKPLLQGWAIVDNTVGEDWNDVELSLVAGAPHSFIQPLSQPYYAHRPVVPLPESMQSRPQTHDATLRSGSGSVSGVIQHPNGAALPGATVRLKTSSGAVVAEAHANASGRYELSAAPDTYELTVSLQGFSSVSRNVDLRDGRAVGVDATLRMSGVSETIAVTASTPASDVARRRKGGVGGGAAGGLGAGVAGGVVGALPEAPPPPPAEPMRVAGNLQPAATGQDLGDLFEYRLKQPVTIRKNQSALVPILNAPVGAERVSLWNRAPGKGRPLQAVWLTNSSSLTLDGGTFSVIDGNAFAGEGLIEPLKPGEKRLISYGTDLGVMVDARLDNSSGHYTRFVAKEGYLIATKEERQRWIYRARNEDTDARTLVIEHPVANGWTVGKDPAPVEMTASAARFRLPIAAKSEASLTVSLERVEHRRFWLGDIGSDIAGFEHEGAPTAALRDALKPVLDKSAEVSALQRRLAELQKQTDAITRDQARLRENMKALRGSDAEKALLQRYTRELNAQEDRLADLRGQTATATKELEARQAELVQLVSQLTFDLEAAR